MRFSTNLLYLECSVLRVRQLYILSVAIKFHRNAHSTRQSSCRSRRNVTWQKPRTRLDFGKRCFQFMGPFIYSKLNKELNILQMTKHKCKTHVIKFLKTLNYDTTESFFKNPY
ncbi:hypothetical protein PYW08_013781 [Mythimna loreyi]|uniref:Uncharacterized protein n=1 Tax=Mythimna loreyi TaxID=667449 RepID=A0ACC2R5X9_9NEOP|nr:hypothetical protein PYW08_013781 [Mythimna loreyi]